MTPETRPGRSLFLGLFLITSATILLEITLTRIFSVTMWYHYAFMAISLALFGMSMGAVVAYLAPKRFPQKHLSEKLAELSFFMGLSLLVGFWLYLRIPFTPEFSVAGLLTVVLAFLLTSVPFVFSGILVALILTRFPAHVGRLYAVDLVGAALGTLLMLVLTTPLSGFGVVLFVAFIAALAGVVFSMRVSSKLLVRNAVLAGIALVLAVLQPHTHLFYADYVKNATGETNSIAVEGKPVFERWNHHSLVSVLPFPDSVPFGWGMSRNAPPPPGPVPQYYIVIDAAAGTIITKFDGDTSKIPHLRYDLTALVHYVRPGSKTLVIGTGGGRDLLTALSFDPKEVVGVEINDQILELINEDLGDFTGHLDRNPKVRFVNDEARSFVERSGETFDIIQASLIDSWAATSAGAFVLTENSLYTVEGWTEFMDHLTERGVVTMSRWWFSQKPSEMLRLANVAREALVRRGVKDVSRHFLIAVNAAKPADPKEPSIGVGTLIAAKNPFSEEDIQRFQDTCRQMDFDILYAPGLPGHAAFEKLIDPATHDELVAKFPLNIRPATDDSPYFFNQLSFRDALFGKHETMWMTDFNLKAMVTLAVLFLLVLVLASGGLIAPLLWDRARRKKAGAPMPTRKVLLPHSTYFAAIGLAFILLEIGQLQRFNIFLGHPVYSLGVILFSLLLSTGIGSFLADRFVLRRDDWRKAGRLVLVLLAVVALSAALFTPSLMRAFHGAPIPPRLLASVALLFVMGLPMGTAFPLGLRAAQGKVDAEAPWLWAVNGAFSVIGSVLAVILSIEFGITVTCLVGAGLYLIPMLLYPLTSKG